MSSSVGVYFKNGSIQVAHMTGSIRKPFLKTIAEEPFTIDDKSPAELFSKNHIPKKPVSVVLPSRIVNVRQTVLPLTHLAQIRRIIKFHAERLFPGVSPEEIVADYIIIQKSKEFTEILLFVVKKDELEKYLEFLRSNNIKPEIITVDFIALFNLLSHYKLFKGSTTTAAFDFSNDEIKMFLVRKGVLRLFRRLPLAADKNVEERLFSMLKYSMTSTGISDQIDRMILSGRLPESLDFESLRAKVSYEVIPFDLPAVIHYSKKEGMKDLLQDYLVASGVALENYGKTDCSIDLGREEYKYHTPYEILRKPVFIALIMLVIFITIEFLGTMEAVNDAQTYLYKMNSFAKILFSRVVKGKKPRFTSTFNKTLAALAKQKMSNASNESGWSSFLDFMSVLSEYLPANYKTVIQSINFGNNKVVIRGEAENVESFEELAKGLEKSGKFNVRTPYRIKSGRRNLPARLVFTIELTPRGK